MKRRRFPWMIFLILILAVLPAAAGQIRKEKDNAGSGIDKIVGTAREILLQEPEETRELRKQEVPQTDEGHQEYYFQLLDDAEKRGYREMLEGIRNRDPEFYLTISEDTQVDRVYHAVLKDHPELFWVHNREQVYKTTYSNSDYCLFSPGYTYTDAEIQEIARSMESAFDEVSALIPEQADDYEKTRIVYTYLIDTVEYMTSEHDQSIAGAFGKRVRFVPVMQGLSNICLSALVFPAFMWREAWRTARKDMHGILCGWMASIIMWIPQMETSRNFWREMPCRWRSIKQRFMITSVRFRRNMKCIIRLRQSLHCRHVMLMTKTFMY